MFLWFGRVEIGSLAREADIRYFGFEYQPGRRPFWRSEQTVMVIVVAGRMPYSRFWLAGKVMSHCSDHAAIVEMLNRMERKTGWATAWRVGDLRSLGGEDEDEDRT